MKKGSIIEGEITAITTYGAFVKLDNDKTGMIHISEFSDSYVRSIEDYISIGDIVKLKVINSSDDKIQLSFKALNKHKKKLKISLDTGFKPLKEQLPIWVNNYDKDSE